MFVKLFNLKQDHPQRKWFFKWNPYKIEVMITSLIEILELPNFSHMTTSPISLEARNNVLFVMSWKETMKSWPLLKNTLLLRKFTVAIYGENWIMNKFKVLTMFIKKIFKGSKKVKRILNYVSKYKLHLYFLT